MKGRVSNGSVTKGHVSKERESKGHVSRYVSKSSESNGVTKGRVSKGRVAKGRGKRANTPNEKNEDVLKTLSQARTFSSIQSL